MKTAVGFMAAMQDVTPDTIKLQNRRMKMVLNVGLVPSIVQPVRMRLSA